MAKGIFLTIFMLSHAAVTCISGFISFATVFNMCGPAHAATPLTYITGITSLIFLCPIAIPSFFVLSWLDVWELIPAAILLNSYLWGLGLWRWRTAFIVRRI